MNLHCHHWLSENFFILSLCILLSHFYPFSVYYITPFLSFLFLPYYPIFILSPVPYYPIYILSLYYITPFISFLCVLYYPIFILSLFTILPHFILSPCTLFPHFYPVSIYPMTSLLSFL